MYICPRRVHKSRRRRASAAAARRLAEARGAKGACLSAQKDRRSVHAAQVPRAQL